MAKGALLSFNRKLKVWHKMSRMKNGRKQGHSKVFPKGTLAIYLGEVSNLPWQLIPDLKVAIDGQHYEFWHETLSSLSILEDGVG
jgi:hypothetical protein